MLSYFENPAVSKQKQEQPPIQYYHQRILPIAKQRSYMRLDPEILSCEAVHTPATQCRGAHGRKSSKISKMEESCTSSACSLPHYLVGFVWLWWLGTGSGKGKWLLAARYSTQEQKSSWPSSHSSPFQPSSQNGIRAQAWRAQPMATWLLSQECLREGSGTLKGWVQSIGCKVWLGSSPPPIPNR